MLKIENLHMRIYRHLRSYQLAKLTLAYMAVFSVSNKKKRIYLRYCDIMVENLKYSI